MKYTQVYNYAFFDVIVDVSSVLTAIYALPSLVYCKALLYECFRLAAKRFKYAPLKCNGLFSVVKYQMSPLVLNNLGYQTTSIGQNQGQRHKK